MELRNSFFLNFRNFVANPILENVKVLKDVSSQEIHQLSAMNQESLVLSAIFTTVAELKTRNKNEITYHLVETATKIISNTKIKTLISMQSMLAILLKSISLGPTNSLADSGLSEELKLSIINCFAAIFRRASPEVIREFYNKDNLNLVAQIVFMSEQIVASEKYRPLRIAGINCITSIFQVQNESNEFDTKQRQQVADLVFIIIPKIIATLLKVTTESSDTLTACSVAALGRILHLIFEDYEIESYTPHQIKLLIEKPTSNSPNQPSSVEDHFRGKKETKRDHEWLKFASSKLMPSIEKMKTLTCNKSDSVRQELYKLSDTLLRCCQRNLGPCIRPLLEINVTLLDSKRERSLSIYNENVIDIIEECLLNHLIRLPRIIHTGNDEEQLAGFAQFRGFVQLLHNANRLKITLANDNVLGNFIANLLLAVELDRHNNLLETTPNSSKAMDLAHAGVLSNHESIPWKIYKNLQQNEIVKEIQTICLCVREQKETYNFILSHLSELLIKNSANCNEALVLIQIFAMNSVEQIDPCESLHASILETLHSDFRWKLATQIIEVSSVGEESTTSRWYEDSVEGVYDSALTIRLTDVQPHASNPERRVTLKEIKNNILHMCLVIETIGCYAKRIKQQHKIYLMKSLHRLIEKLASPHFMIRSSTFNALEHFKVAFDQKSISDLIFSNADYVSHSIHTSLKKSQYIDTMLRTLINSMQCGSIESVPNLENIVETLIAESAKPNQSKNALTFLNAFELILSSIRDSALKSGQGDIASPDKAVANDDYYKKWLNILEAGRQTIPNDDEMDENDEELDANEESHMPKAEMPDEKQANPPSIDLTIKIVKRVIPYASSIDVNVKLVALECLAIGLEIIKDYEDEILPIIYVTWDLLVQQCILNKNPIFVRPCLRVLKNIAVYAKDFINTKSCSQLLSYLNKHLIDFRKKYAKQKETHLQEYSQDFKTLREIITQYPIILKSLTINEKDLDATLNAVAWLLQENHFSKTNIFDFYKALISHDICTVHLKLLNHLDGEWSLLKLMSK